MKGVRSQPGHISRNHSHAVNEYIDQLEAEKKALIEALKAVESVTKDETLPLFRVINQIAAKSLKAIK